ncbi:MAG TPA: O-antigen ligase family protein [Verrucomicrobiae bacterium]|nr:O-antigen ligase family protein [Verrucomicrobiae bacterium]
MDGVASAFSRAAAAARATASRPQPRYEAAPAAAPRDSGHGWLIGGAIWLLVVMMIVPEGFDYVTLATDGGAPVRGGTLNRLLWLALLGAGSIAILLRAGTAWLMVRWLNPFLLLFVVLAAASVAWSIDPPVTARRLIRVFTILTLSTGLVLMAWHPHRLQAVLRPVITLVLLASLAFGIGWPELAIHEDPSGILQGAWHGLANHKNGLGDLACIGLVLWTHAWLSREVHAAPALAGLIIAAACLLLSRSSTSLVATAFTLVFLVLLLSAPPGLRRYMPWIVALFIGALVGYSLVLLGILPGLHTLMSPIGAITGKDMTFTGRTDIWEIMFEHIRGQQWLGSGYGAYWTGTQQGSPSFEFVDKLGFDPGSAHNGYLDILNDLGTIGLLVLFGYLATFVTQALRLLPGDRVQSALLLALFLQQAITNLAESRWFSPLSVDFVIMTLATAALGRALLEQHRANASARILQR